MLRASDKRSQNTDGVLRPDHRVDAPLSLANLSLHFTDSAIDLLVGTVTDRYHYSAANATRDGPAVCTAPLSKCRLCTRLYRLWLESFVREDIDKYYSIPTAAHNERHTGSQFICFLPSTMPYLEEKPGIRIAIDRGGTFCDLYV